MRRTALLCLVSFAYGCSRPADIPSTPAFAIEFDAIAGVTTRTHPVPGSEPLPVPIGARVVLRAKPLRDSSATSVWSGARVLAQTKGRTAEFRAARPGIHTIEVRTSPTVRQSFRIEVVDVAAKDITVRIKSPLRPPVHLGGEVSCACETSPAQFARIVEWEAQGMQSALGFGREFRTLAPNRNHGSQPRIQAHVGPRFSKAPSEPVLYTVHWVRKPSKRDYFQATPTIRLYHEIRTDPPGFEDHVPWTYDTTGTGIASATTGRGRSFTVVRTNDRWHNLLCWEVKAGNATDSADEINRLLETPLDGREDQPPKNRDCGPPAPAAHSLPITLSNGEATLEVVDLHVPSRGFDFVWKRTYASRANFRGCIGWNWKLGIDRRVFRVRGTTSVSVVDGDKREDLYVRGAGSSYVSAAGYYDRLVENTDGTFTQIDQHGTRFDYDGQGNLIQITDRTGANSMTLLRNNFGNVVEIVDTQDRAYRIRYTDNTRQQLIRSITDFRGRSVIYTYDRAWNLIAVRSPAVLGTPTGNDFPSGKTTLYTYSSGSFDNRLNHNLLSVTEPLYNLGNDPSRSRPFVTLTYASTTNPRADDFDHVIAERWGNDRGGPPNDPNRVVGGTSRFAYTRDLTGDSNAPATAVLRTTETTRNGNTRLHYFDLGMHEIRTIERTNRGIRPGEGDYTTDYSFTPEGLLASITHPRGNRTRFLYDTGNTRRASQRNLLEKRSQVGAVGGGLADLVTRYTHDPVFNQVRTVTDPRAFPAGQVPLTSNGRLDLSNALVRRYTTTTIFDYQEGTGFQAARGVPPTDRIPEGLGDQNGAIDFDAGNPVAVFHPTIQTDGPNKGQQVRETSTWNRHGQLLRHVDPEGSIQQTEYYATNSVARDASDLEGYVRSVTEDVTGLALKTSFVYDTSGNVTARLDPKGQRTDFTLNELNQVVRTLSRPVGAGFRYRADVIYDANDNPVRREVLNLGEGGQTYTHDKIVTRFEYDILHKLVAREDDKTRNGSATSGFVRTEFTYDAHTNRTSATKPRPILSARPATIITVQFDERELPYKTIVGDNNTNPYDAPPAGAVIATTNYDANGNQLERIDTLRQSVRGGPTARFPLSASGDLLQHTYDGFDRVLKTVDGESYETRYTYDGNSNVVRASQVGPADHTASAPVRTLIDTSSTYDELNRVVQRHIVHTDAAGAPVGDGRSTMTWTYDREGKVTTVTDDRGLSEVTTWDTADRKLQVRDALNNTTDLTYDANGNIVRQLVTERSSDLSSPPETFTTQFFYDGIDRLVRTIDPAGSVVESFYDSRDNVVRTSDGVRGGSGNGNVITFEFDALDRLVRSEFTLTSTGRGNGSVTGRIVTQQAWDDDSLLASRTDDNSHTTRYDYDALGRAIGIRFANNTSRTSSYNTDNQRIQWTDQNGTRCDMRYDGVARLRDRTVTPAQGVLGATIERYGYDGASRTTLVQTNDIFSSNLFDCRFAYDSLSNRELDGQGPHSLTSRYDGVGNRVGCTYPGSFATGSRTFSATYDSLNRLRTVGDGDGSIAVYSYKGPARLERRSYDLGTTGVSRVDCRYDAVPRLIELNHVAGTQTTPFAAFHYGHDREHHRLFEKRVHESNTGDVYAYDSIYRLQQNLNKVDLSAVTSGARIDPATFSSPDSLAYDFDGVGNRTTVVQRVGGTPTSTLYTQAPGDAEVNQYTTVRVGSQTAMALDWDNNGNLIAHGTTRYSYDFKNRLVEVRDAAQNPVRVVARYSYDPLERRAKKVVDPNGTTPRTTSYVYDDDQCVEERDGQGNLIRQFVWGPGTDELCQVKNGRLATQTLYSHENASGNVAALIDGAGTVVERYGYDGFGNTTVTLNGQSGNEYRFHAARFDPESGLYWMRARHYSPALGRFVQRDPIGIWTDGANVGNGYTLGGNDLVNTRDPSGLWPDWEWLGYYASHAVSGMWSDTKAAARGAWHAATNPVQTAKSLLCAGKRAFNRAVQRSQLGFEHGGGAWSAALQFTASLVGDFSGTNQISEGIVGVDFDDFVGTGNWNELTMAERSRRGALGVAQLATMFTARGVGSAGFDRLFNESIYRVMSQAEWKAMRGALGRRVRYGENPRRQLFVTQNRGYTERLARRPQHASKGRYEVAVEFRVRRGTFRKLLNSGATHDSAAKAFPRLPRFRTGTRRPQVKHERGGVLSVGIGYSRDAVRQFNRATRRIRRLN